MSAVPHRYGPYRAYRRRNFKWEPLFDEVINGKSVAKVAREHRIPQTTLNHHFLKYQSGKENDDPQLVEEAAGRSDGRKRSRRILSDADEERMYTEYKDDSGNGLAVTGADLHRLAMQIYGESHAHYTRSEIDSNFSASSSYVRRFERDYHVSLGIVKKKHRPDSYPSEERLWRESTIFFEQINTAQLSYPPHLIINADETPGKVVTPPLRALRDIGGGPPMVNHKAKAKLAVTFMVGLAQSGAKLNTSIVTRGKTTRSLTKFNLPSTVIGFLTPKGYTNAVSFIGWIDRVLTPYTKGVPCALIVDDYAAHQTPAVHEHCRLNNIELIIVPGWLTPDLQPLDVGIFGAIKETMRHLWSVGMKHGDDQTDTLAGLVRRLTKALNHVSKGAVLEAFKSSGWTGVADRPATTDDEAA